MRMLLLLLHWLGLAAADCPEFLRGIDLNASSYIRRFDEAVDVACGRANYSSVFWSRLFYEQLLVHLVNRTDDPDFVTYKPLFKSLQDKFDSLEGPDASEAMLELKGIVDGDIERYQKIYGPKKPINDTDDENAAGGFMGMMFGSIILPILTFFPPQTAIALEQTMKGGFGVVETVVMRQEWVDTAMKAIERVGVDSGDEKMGELFARLYVLATDTMGLRRAAFDQFADWAENKWNSTEIGPLEIVPGVEVLYVQYQSLQINESKTFVDWVLASHAKVDANTVPFNISRTNTTEEVHSIIEEFGREAALRVFLTPSLYPVDKQPRIMAKVKEGMVERESEFAAICPSGKVAQCFSELKAEAKMEIIATFPELFEHLNNMPDYAALTSTGMNKDSATSNQLKMEEGSGEGSGDGSGMISNNIGASRLSFQ